MKILIVGSNKNAVAMEAQLVILGYSVGHAHHEIVAAQFLVDGAFDLVLFAWEGSVDEADRIATMFKRVAVVGPSVRTPYIVLVCTDESTRMQARARRDDSQGADEVMEMFSVKRCEEIRSCLSAGGGL